MNKLYILSPHWSSYSYCLEKLRDNLIIDLNLINTIYLHKHEQLLGLDKNTYFYIYDYNNVEKNYQKLKYEVKSWFKNVYICDEENIDEFRESIFLINLKESLKNVHSRT